MAYYLIILVLIMVPIILLKLKVTKNKESSKKDKLNNAQKLIKENKDCYYKKQFMTNKERAFYSQLVDLAKDKYYVMAQVRVVDIINPNEKYKKTSKEFISLFRQISQWHCDFLIVNIETFEIIHAIELDDSTHNKKELEEIKY